MNLLCEGCEQPTNKCKCNSYERIRQENIKRNEQKFREIFPDLNKSNTPKEKKKRQKLRKRA